MGERKETCQWHYFDYPATDCEFEGECGVVWAMTDGGLAENGMNFCPRCGGAINFVPPVADEEEDTDVE